MKKIKFKQRIENARNAFFETGDDKGEDTLVYTDGTTYLRNEESTSKSEKSEIWVNLAMQLLWFLPGAFLLFFATLSSIFFFPYHGLTLQMVFWFFAGGFLCVAGMGSLKNAKNLLIPLAIVLFTATVAALFSLFPTALQQTLYFNYSIYLFPLVLIGSSLLKSWINDK
jgi:cation transport ATPase